VKRSELAHLLRAASTISGRDEILVIGSQSILGSFDEDELPDPATLSREADFAFWDDADERIADKVDGAIGEMSAFDLGNGYYAQGVSVTTATLPVGWRDRLVQFSPTSANGAVAMCLEPHDLALAKLVARREKDLAFVAALIAAQLLDIAVLRERAESMPVSGPARRLMIRTINAWSRRPSV
jgi:hypothetical protein